MRCLCALIKVSLPNLHQVHKCFKDIFASNLQVTAFEISTADTKTDASQCLPQPVYGLLLHSAQSMPDLFFSCQTQLHGILAMALAIVIGDAYPLHQNLQLVQHYEAIQLLMNLV